MQYNPNFVMRADAPVKDKVALISGGGSGHEPMHGGFVGKGMLDAACPGAVFTSPTPDQMHAATKAVAGEKGALHIVKNYTGDVMNFELAAEMLRAEDLSVESVVIDDDVAVQDSTWTAGRRGVGATVLAEKLCGAAAEDGRPLASLRDLCKRINSRARSMGMALTSCTVPHVGKPTFDLPEDEMELGVGIHGEPGASAPNWPGLMRSSRCSWNRSSATCPSSPAMKCCSLSTDRRHAFDRAFYHLRQGR